MKKRLLVIFLVFIALVGCSAAPGSPPTSANDSQASPSAAPSATNALVPTQTATLTAEPVLPTDTSLPTLTPTPAVYGPDNFPEYVNPLSGMPINSPSILDRRPVAVKVQLFPRGQRPVFGVSQADQVFDFYQNDGLTRLHAIFYGKDAEQVGPVRSARLFDDELIRMYESIFAFGGASSQTLEELYNSGYAERLVMEGGTCPALCRTDPNGFNFLMADTAALTDYTTSQGVENERQQLDGMVFDSQVPPGGQPGQQVTTRYSISAYNRWEYDPTSGRYLRFQDTQEDDGTAGEGYAPLMDGASNTQVAADNVVVLLMDHGIVDPAAKNKVIDINSYGSGPAYVFRDGQMYEALWNRPEAASIIYLTTKEGTVFPLKPGSTWYQVIGSSSQTEQEGDGAWRFRFNIP